MTREDLRTAKAALGLRFGWIAVIAGALGVHAWNVFRGPLLRGYDAHGHLGYVLYLDLYRAVPWADQGWSYFHPPLHYGFGWALAQLGDADVLLRGLSALASVWSLGIAWLASRLVARVSPERPALAWLAFTSVALLPVYLYASTMIGNELLAACLSTLALVVYLSNEADDAPAPGRDAAVGALLGLALLAKFSSVLALGAVGLSIALRALREPPLGAAVVRALRRGAIVVGVAAVVASPYYARNVAEFGTPLKMSRDNPFVAKAEAGQPPGSRSWVDFVSFPPALFGEPDLRGPALLHSVWGSAYAQMWSDLRVAWDGIEWNDRPALLRARRWMVALGVPPTLLALLGALLAVRDSLRGRRVRLYVPLLTVAAASLAAFVYFAIAAPHWSALKASYLLGLTLPYAVFLARGVEAFPARGWTAAAISMLVVVPAAASALVHSDGVVVPRLGDAMAVGSLRFHFGDREGARRDFEERGSEAFGAKHSWPQWRDNLAAIALQDGDPVRARSLYRRHRPAVGEDPIRWNATAVATALSGALDEALPLADQALEAGAGAIGLVNRGVIRAQQGDLAGAERDLLGALEREPDLAPAWHDLVEVLQRRGAPPEDVVAAREEAARAAAAAPRGHPYGIPDGFGQNPSWKIDLRWMLWLEGDALRLARAPFRDGDALAMRDPATLLAERPNVVLIVVDTLRADHLGAWGYTRPTSPRLDALAADGVRFARASAPSSWTLPSVASLFTSTRPTRHRVSAWGEDIDPRFVTLAERFADAGYHGVGVSGNFVHVTEEAGFARGFASWQSLHVKLDEAGRDSLLAMPGPEGELSLRAPTAIEINSAVLAELPPANGAPLFLYVHYMEPHSGYDPPEAVRRRFVTDPQAHAKGPAATSAYVTGLARAGSTVDADERQRLIDLYDAEIATVDAGIGELLDALEARGFADRSVVAVVSDHGEELGDHGSWFHGLTLFSESVSIPLLIRDSRRPAWSGRVVETPVDLVDVATTLLDLAGIEPAPEMRGRSLLADTPARPRDLIAALAEDPTFEKQVRDRLHLGSLVRGSWKVVLPRDGRAQVFDLAADPHETRPLALRDPKVPVAVRESGRGLAAELMGGPREPKKSQYLPLKMRARLRALGYAE